MPDFGNDNSGRVGVGLTSSPYSQIVSSLTTVVRRFCGHRELGALLSKIPLYLEGLSSMCGMSPFEGGSGKGSSYKGCLFVEEGSVLVDGGEEHSYKRIVFTIKFNLKLCEEVFLQE
eukprot:6465502-Amphidinium_carterae.1